MPGDYISAALRQFVTQRAKGCCEYCLTPESIVLVAHEVDHIVAQSMVD